ncbi:transcription initiation protein SPT3 homolog [Lepeophtheirus salmonis]|uniref:Suppressor of Ty 3 homolog (S. cerevisiae) [Chinchilla lanigera] n=1 Tax=Lepeophtheirus salmonis TaxID=72036 RepID=A0A0K2UW35_LEPSM|nr:transcription initiation protein SPT3 homolog [Lepeophtheirus salmonis]
MYVHEIMSMMHGFGDARKPNSETAVLIEEIVRGQMYQLLKKAIEVYQLSRGGGESGLINVTISVDELLFLMRKSPIRVQRLIKYLSVRDAVSTLEESEDSVAGDLGSKRAKKCKDFLERIDTDGTLTDAVEQKLVDDVRTSRLHRLDLLSRDLDERKYAEFTKARQSNFRGPKFPIKFHQWITREMSEDIKITKFGLEILSYLSYETVGQLVDLALLFRCERSNESDPVARQMTPLSINPQFPMVQIKKNTTNNNSAEPSTPGGDSKVDDSALQPWEVLQVIQRLHHRIQPLEWYHRGEKRAVSCPLFVV